MPAIEAGVGEVQLGGDDGGVEGAVVGVPQLNVLQALVRLDEAVADDLDLGLVGDGLEVRVEDGALGVDDLAVAVRGGEGVEAVGEVELGLGGRVGLVLEDKDLMLEESGANEVKVGIEEVTDCNGYSPWRLRHYVVHGFLGFIAQSYR